MSTATRRRKPAPNTARSSSLRPRGRVKGGARVTWWLTADVEVCAVCGEGYAYGSGYRCTGCDAAVCTFCIENRSGEIWCVEC